MEQNFQEISKTPRAKVRGGVIAIVSWMVFFIGFLKIMIAVDSSLYDALDNLANMMTLSGLFFIFLYVALMRKYQITDPLKRFGLVVASIILLTISAAYIDKWTAIPSKGTNILEEYGREIADKNYPEKLQEILQKNQEVTDTLALMEKSPSNEIEATDYVLKIDRVIILIKEMSADIQEVHSVLLSMLDRAETENAKNELKQIIKADFKRNLDVLPEYSYQFNIYIDANIKNLEARKKYYQSYINDEAESVQNFLLGEWDGAENTYLAEEKKLLALQAELIK